MAQQLREVTRVSLEALSTEIRSSHSQEDVKGEPIPGNEWRISKLIGGYAYPADAGYDRVEDVVINPAGEVLAVVVDPDVTYGLDGYYAWPFYGFDYGFDPGLDYYEVPYGEDEVAELEPFDYEVFDDADPF